MRETIQSKLNEVKDVECGENVPDGLIENDTTYFGYTIQSDYINTDMDKNNTLKVTIIGYLVRRKKTTENTLKIVDDISNNIIKKLKELNFKLSIKDIDLDSNIQKKEIKGFVYYNEINNKLVL